MLPPTLGGLGVIDPRGGQKTEAEVLGEAIEVAKTKKGMRSKCNIKTMPVAGVEVEIGDDIPGANG